MSMEAVAGMMEKMNLSEAEKKGIRVKAGGDASLKTVGMQAIGKVLADRPVHTEALEQTLGKVWCPIRGIDCKDLGLNHFLFTFHQPSGKKRAIHDGPWLFGKDLIVVVDFDGRKRLEDIKFDNIPIWIRVSGLPLGMMNKETGEMIGNEVGAFVDMDLEEDGSAVGQYLRIKVRLNITKPLMRGVSLVVEDGEAPLWCPMVYEYLPDFCYSCGIVGHIDKVCAGKGEGSGTQQFSKKLRFMPEKKRWEEGFGGGGNNSRRSGSWRSGGSGDFGRNSGGSKGIGSGSMRSGSLTWRKNDENEREEPEVQSPLKKFIPPQRRESGQRTVALNLEKKIDEVMDDPKHRVAGEKGGKNEKEKTGHDADMKATVVKNLRGEEKEKEGRKKGKYKKIEREQGGRSDGPKVKVAGGKRSNSDMDVDEHGKEKRLRGVEGEVTSDNQLMNAELADQLCGNQ